MANPLAKTALKGVTILAGSAAALKSCWWLYSTFGIDHHVALPPALDAARRELQTASVGKLSYYKDAQPGRTDSTPLVLIHSVNAAASAFEVRPLFERFRGERSVYALELPGFGFSDRADRAYTPELYVEALLEFLATLEEVADVVALSLSSEFLAQAAVKQPERFRSLTFISPTGMNTKREARASDKAGKRGGNDTFYQIVSQPLWARAFFDLIATRPSIRYFLQQSFVGDVPRDLEHYAYLTSHQPGAEHAPLTFVSGKLFTPDIRERVYERLSVPTLVLYDTDAFVSFETLPELLVVNPNVRAQRLAPSRGLPHFDLPERTAQVLHDFWRHQRGTLADGGDATLGV